MRFDEFVQFFEACGIGRRAVYQVDGSKNASGDFLGSRTQLDQSALMDFPVAIPLGDAIAADLLPSG